MGAGTEAAALAQYGELRLFRHRLCLQGDAVCILRRLFFHVRLLQRKPALHPLPCRAGGQLRTGYAEPRRAAVHTFHPQGRVHCVRKIVTVRALHLSSQQHGAPGVICPDTLQPGARGMHRAKPRQCAQQQTERQLAAAARDAKQQQKGNKKCRKRHKKLRLRQKSPQETKAHHSGAERAERAAHPGLVEEQGQRLKEDDILALRSVALGQNSGLTHDGALGLFCQRVQCLQRAAGGDDIVHHQHTLAVHLF